jgi:hypothetical protein
MHPPGMCWTSTPRSWTRWTTDAIIWHRYESKKRIGRSPSGAVFTYGSRTASTHMIMTLLSIHAFFWTAWSSPYTT